MNVGNKQTVYTQSSKAQLRSRLLSGRPSQNISQIEAVSGRMMPAVSTQTGNIIDAETTIQEIRGLLKNNNNNQNQKHSNFQHRGRTIQSSVRKSSVQKAQMENNSIRSNQTGVAGPSDPNNYSAIYSQNSQGGGAIPTKQYYAAKPYEFKHRETLNQTVIVAGSYYNTTAGHPKKTFKDRLYMKRSYGKNATAMTDTQQSLKEVSQIHGKKAQLNMKPNFAILNDSLQFEGQPANAVIAWRHTPKIVQIAPNILSSSGGGDTTLEASTIKKRKRPSTVNKITKQSSQKDAAQMEIIHPGKVRIQIGEKKNTMQFQDFSIKDNRLSATQILNKSPSLKKNNSILPKEELIMESDHQNLIQQDLKLSNTLENNLRSRELQSYLQDSFQGALRNTSKNRGENESNFKSSINVIGESIVINQSEKPLSSNKNNHQRNFNQTTVKSQLNSNLQTSGNKQLTSEKKESTVFVSVPSVLQGPKMIRQTENSKSPNSKLLLNNNSSKRLIHNNNNVESSENKKREQTQNQELYRRPSTANYGMIRYQQASLIESKSNMSLGTEQVKQSTIGGNQSRPQTAQGGTSSHTQNKKSVAWGDKNKMLDFCFPFSTTTLKLRVGNGSLKKAFCEPVAQRWRDEGLQSLHNTQGGKTLKKKYEQMKTQIIKLRHLLVNDPDQSHEYIFKFLKQFFSLQEIGAFTDFQLKNFIGQVVEQGDKIIVDPRASMKEFLQNAMFSSHPYTEPMIISDNSLGSPKRTVQLLHNRNKSQESLASSNGTALNQHRRVGSLAATLKIEESNFNSEAKEMVNRYHNREESIVQVDNNNYIRHEYGDQSAPYGDKDMEHMLKVIQQCQSPGTPKQIIHDTKWSKPSNSINQTLTYQIPQSSTTPLLSDNTSFQQSRNPPQVQIAYRNRNSIEGSTKQFSDVYLSNIQQRTQDINGSVNANLDSSIVSTQKQMRPKMNPIMQMGTASFGPRQSLQKNDKKRQSNSRSRKEHQDQQEITAKLNSSIGSKITAQEKQLVYSPTSGKPEISVKRPSTQISRALKTSSNMNTTLTNLNIKSSLRNNLSLISGTNAVQTPSKILRDYLNMQEIRLAVEIAPPQFQAIPKKDCILTFVTEFEGHNPQIKQIQEKQTKDGIMRRNKLLLEHIMHERMQSSISTMNYYSHQNGGIGMLPFQQQQQPYSIFSD